MIEKELTSSEEKPLEKEGKKDAKLILKNVHDRSRLTEWRELGLIQSVEDSIVRYCDFGLDHNWVTLKHKLQLCAREEFGANLSEVNCVLRFQRAKKMIKVGSVWKRRDGAISTLNITDKSALWVRRVLALDGNGVLRYFEGLTVDDWSKFRGEMRVGAVRWTEPINTVRDTLGSPPSAHVFCVESQDSTNLQWLICVQDELEALAWRDALKSVTTNQKITNAINYQIATVTEGRSASQRQFRYLIVECMQISASVDMAILGIIDVLDMEADTKFAERLSAREKMILLSESNQAPALAQLDPRIGAEMLAARLLPIKNRLEQARCTARNKLISAKNRLNKILDLVRSSYQHAKLLLADTDSLDVSPTSTELLAPMIKTWDPYDSEQFVQAQIFFAINKVTDEENQIIEQFFAHTNDVGTTCRLARRAFAARATTILGQVIDDCANAAQAIAFVQLAEHMTLQVSKMDNYAVNICHGFHLAVTSSIAWVGPDSATAKLWTIDKDAAKIRDPALCSLSAMYQLIPGTLFLGTRAIYFKPSASLVGGIFARALNTAKPESIRLDLLTDILSLERVPSPVPLKNNALQITSAKNNQDYVFTLNTPGASITATLDLIDACRRSLVKDLPSKRGDKNISFFSPNEATSDSKKNTTTLSSSSTKPDEAIYTPSTVAISESPSQQSYEEEISITQPSSPPPVSVKTMVSNKEEGDFL